MAFSDTYFGTNFDTNSIEPRGNLLLNSDFALWQRGTSTQISFNTAAQYLADRWYVLNNASVTQIIVASQVAGVNPGSRYGLQVKVTQGGGGADYSAWQVLESLDSLQLTNSTVSFGCRVKALGNLNGIGLQFMYAATEIKPTNLGIGTEVIVGITTGTTFTFCPINGQAMGNSFGLSGVVAVRIRGATVSSGAIGDLNNGFVVELCQAVKAPLAPIEYLRQNKAIGDEVYACQRFYQKSYNLFTILGATSQVGAHLERTIVTGSNQSQILLPARMRATPTVHAYSDGTGTIDKVRDNSATADDTAGYANQGESGFNVSWTGTASNSVSYHWTADAEI